MNMFLYMKPPSKIAEDAIFHAKNNGFIARVDENNVCVLSGIGVEAVVILGVQNKRGMELIEWFGDDPNLHYVWFQYAMRGCCFNIDRNMFCWIGPGQSLLADFWQQQGPCPFITDNICEPEPYYIHAHVYGCDSLQVEWSQEDSEKYDEENPEMWLKWQTYCAQAWHKVFRPMPVIKGILCETVPRWRGKA